VTDGDLSAAAAEFGLLGPLEVHRDGVLVPVAAGRQRGLLAALLLNAGTVVSADELIKVLWGYGPPMAARASLHNYVRRLRRALGDASRDLILTRPPGYLIRAGPGQVDAARFEELLAGARAQSRGSDWESAARQARAALALWRGDPLADTGSELLAAREAPRLAEMRLQALEVAIDAELHLGGEVAVLGELRRLVAEHPLRERLHALLMLALYRDGRQGEALAAYQDARRVLAGELGIEPGPGLRDLHHGILTADPALAHAQPERTAASPGRVPPRQLPAGVGHFTGRRDELSALDRLLEETAGGGGAVIITAIGGTAGVGKTTLAVHWAHLAADRFADGQLYVNLRGYDPGQPMTATDALAGFLRALGVPGSDIPPEEDERAARFRSILAGRRMLVVLDNARSEPQVRPLLPGSPGCMVVVTSRDALPGLVARDGSRRLELDVLPLPEAVSLLQALIGARVADDPSAARTLAQQCSRLPLALRVAAELATARPGVSVAGLVDELADQRRRLDRLDAGGDHRTAVRAVFSWSYQSLGDDAADAFRLLSLHPGPDLDCYATAALMDSTADGAARVLDQLARAHLLQVTGAGRYGLHDLLRAFGRELAYARDSAEKQRAALARLFDNYLYGAATAVNVLFPAERGSRPRIPAPATPVPPLTSRATAQAWLETHRGNLADAIAWTAENGWPEHASRLAATLHPYFFTTSNFAEAVTLHGHALRAARSAGDQAAETAALIELGRSELPLGRHQEAADHFSEALSLCAQTGDQVHKAKLLHNLAHLSLFQGRFREAAGQYEQALGVFRESGDQTGEAQALGNLGLIGMLEGRYAQAAGHVQQALGLFRDTGDRTGEAAALMTLGEIDAHEGRGRNAARHLRLAMDLFRETGNLAREANVLLALGDLGHREGQYQDAAGHYERSLQMFRELSVEAAQAKALNGLGRVLLAAGRPAEARARHAAALTLASQAGDDHERARAHDGLGSSYETIGDAASASRQWQEALGLYTELGVPAADEVRLRLAAVRGPDPSVRQPMAASVRTAPPPASQTASPHDAAVDRKRLRR